MIFIKIYYGCNSPSLSAILSWGVFMNILYENFRIGFDKCLLSAQRAVNRISGDRLARSAFTESLDIIKADTCVRIISEDEDSVTIAKTDRNGNILDEGFRIISTSDLHFGDDPDLRNKCLTMLMNQIADTKPDLVVLTGDIILGKYQHIDAIQFAQFMEKIGIYWAFVFGNHEAREEKGRFKELLMKCQTRFPHCLTRQGKKDLFGLCNFCINILKSENEILKTLFMFDSGRDILDRDREKYGVPADMKGYDFIKNDQMEWYGDKLSSLEKIYGDVKSFMYMHIPIKEYDYTVSQNSDGSFSFTDKCEYFYGAAYESVGSSGFNSGLFSLIKEKGSTEAVFCGHDHLNGYCVKYDGVFLVYNQTGGYETYNLLTNKGMEEKDWMQGVTVTDISRDGTVKISPRYNSIYLK